MKTRKKEENKKAQRNRDDKGVERRGKIREQKREGREEM